MDKDLSSGIQDLLPTGQPVFGDMLRRLRRHAGLTQEALAERAGLSVRAITTLERGVSRRPRRDTVQLLSDALDLSNTERAAFERAAAHLTVERWPIPMKQPRTNLPGPLSSFVGREEEQARLEQLVHDHRLVTVTGPGGIGKTRLAIRVADTVLETFADGVFFASLSSITAPGLLETAIASVLGEGEASPREQLQRIAAQLRDSHALVILDTFEHLLDAAPTVSNLLAACPTIHVLVTSREALRLSGEREMVLPPLSLPDPGALPETGELLRSDAVALFLERARAKDSDFALTVLNAPAIASICHKLEGLPLALELAAARISLLPPETLLTRLSDRFSLLTGGPRDAPPRQTSLRATIDWSYALLSPADKILFARLSVFSSGCTVSAAERVCSVDGTERGIVLDQMQSLLAKSLIRRDDHCNGEPRIVMLDSIHEYAAEKLKDTSDERTIHNAHAAYFLAFAREMEPGLQGRGQRAVMDIVEIEIHNLRAAIDWFIRHDDAESCLLLGISLYKLWQRRGYATEGRAWLQRGLTAGERVSTPVLAQARFAAGSLALSQNDALGTVKHLDQSLRLYRRLGDRRGEALSLRGLGVAALFRGDFATGTSSLEQALVLARAIDGPVLIATITNDLGMGAFWEGDYERAEMHFQECVGLWNALSDSICPGSPLGNLGHVTFHRGDHRRAAVLLRESLVLLRERGFQLSCLEGLEAIAAIFVREDRPLRAARLLGAMEDCIARTGSPMPPFGRHEYLRTIAQARADVGEEVWQAAGCEGRRMTIDQAIDYALVDVG